MQEHHSTFPSSSLSDREDIIQQAELRMDGVGFDCGDCGRREPYDDAGARAHRCSVCLIKHIECMTTYARHVTGLDATIRYFA
jgi:hypothetical protein